MTTRSLSWVPSPMTRRGVTLAFAALAVAALSADPAPVALAVPVLAALAVLLRRPRPSRLDVRATLEVARTFEGEPVRLDAHADVAQDGTDRADDGTEDAVGGTGSVRLSLRPEPPVRVVEDTTGVALGPAASTSWTLRAGRWGHWPVGAVTVQVVSSGRAWCAEVTVPGPSLTVFPSLLSRRTAPAPPVLLSRLGPHVSRAPGAGIEFAGIREYVPGDPARRVNWRLSSRRGRLMVNEYAQERMADVVVLIDSVSDTGPPGSTTVDLSVRGAAGVVGGYLRQADRVGVVAFGSSLRWLTPTTGMRHLYVVVETLLEARMARTYVDPSLDRVPLAVLPSGALVVCFSPMLDPVVIEAFRDLRQRGHPVVVVDVLSPSDAHLEHRGDDLALRIWRLERRATRESLSRIGVSVVEYERLVPGSLEWLRDTPTVRAGRR